MPKYIVEMDASLISILKNSRAIRIIESDDQDDDKKDSKPKTVLSDYKRKSVPGLYNYDHFEHPDGSFIQSRHSGMNEIRHWIAICEAEGNQRIPLDFNKLYGKAFKVTDPEGDSDRQGFSVISRIANGSVWDVWQERPQFKSLVQQRLNDPGFLGDYKYRQIVDSAKQLGLI